MYPIVVALTQLQELVDDTCLAAGSEAYAAALQVLPMPRQVDRVGDWMR